MRMLSLQSLSMAALLLVSPMAAGAALASSVEIDIFQGKAVQTVGANGVKAEKIVPTELVVPGDTVVYSYVVRNGGTQTADGVVVNTAVDSNMRYVAGSATPSGVEFSADGGNRFAKEADLRVLDIDGTWRRAVPEDVTNIRWNLEQSVAPGRRFSVGFRAVLK